MNEPLMLLIAGTIGVLIFILVFYPNKGIIASLEKIQLRKQKSFDRGCTEVFVQLRIQ